MLCSGNKLEFSGKTAQQQHYCGASSSSSSSIWTSVMGTATSSTCVQNRCSCWLFWLSLQSLLSRLSYMPCWPVLLTRLACFSYLPDQSRKVHDLLVNWLGDVSYVGWIGDVCLSRYIALPDPLVSVLMHTGTPVSKIVMHPFLLLIHVYKMQGSTKWGAL